MTGEGLRVTGYGSRVRGYRLGDTGYGLRVTGYGLRVTGYGLRLMLRSSGCTCGDCTSTMPMKRMPSASHLRSEMCLFIIVTEKKAVVSSLS